MNKGLAIRLIIHSILLSLKQNNSTFEQLFDYYIKQKQLSDYDKKFIQNTVLTSIRHEFIILEIINNYKSKKKSSVEEYVLLLSAISQIVYLKIKDYAVINCSVEISKSIDSVNYSFINAILRKIAKNKKNFLKKNTNFNLLPSWFKENVGEWNGDTRKNFLTSIIKQPELHLVFKDTKKLDLFKKEFKYKYFQTTEKSLILKNNYRISKLPNYKKGHWWIQDYSAMLPLYLLGKIRNKRVLDMCSAPGGKLFQILALENIVDAYEINNERAKTLNKNLNRLKFNIDVKVDSSMNIIGNKNYDVVLVDAPCSSVGTIRRNPEIFFRKSSLNLDYYINIQSKLLHHASKLVKKRGIIVYMVCSFLKKETNQQINKFLRKHKEFNIVPFKDENDNFDLLSKKGFLKIIPGSYKNEFLIDGFFAVQLVRND